MLTRDRKKDDVSEKGAVFFSYIGFSLRLKANSIEAAKEYYG